MRGRNGIIVVVVAAVVVATVSGGLLLTGGTPPAPDGPSPSGWTKVARPAAQSWESKATALPHVPNQTGPVRVAPGVPPPTNRWYSGMFFGETPQPVFAMPLALQAAADGVAVGLPSVTATPTTVAGAFAPQLRLGLSADGFKATRANPVSVTSTYTRSGTAIGRLNIAEGWPYVAYTALRSQDVTVPQGLEPREGGRWLATEVGGSTYGVAVVRRDGSRRSLSPAGRIRLARDESILVFAGPDTATATALAKGAVPITGTSIAYKVGAGKSRTRVVYRTVGARPTMVAAMPHHRPKTSARVRGRIDSVYGPLRLYRGRSLTTTLPTVQPKGVLDLDRLSDRDRGELRRQVRRDVSAVLSGPEPPADTYFGGKNLYRLAQLYRIAATVDAGQAASRIKQRLVDELDTWLVPSTSCDKSATKCFSYDPRFRGVVGRAASFGSDQFNDHHFHYGYFLAAAGLVGQRNPELLDRWRPTLTALARDIASPVSSSRLPALRNFDPYTGHSWASGTSPFADGNNQESSSEAVNAWNGLALWARADGRDALARQATWQLSAEAATADAYWLEPEHLPEGFDHGFTSLNFGGKRDWATWFSGEPSAILGIQLLPMPPVFESMPFSKRRVRANLAEGAAKGYDVPFGDYLTMYRALAQPERALRAGRRLPDSAIDDGNSRTYMLAWLLSQARK